MNPLEPWETDAGRGWLVDQARRFLGVVRRTGPIVLGDGWAVHAVRVAAVAYRTDAPHLELGDDILKIGRSDFDGVDGLARWLARDVDAATVELQVRRRATGKIIVMSLDKLR